jgi:hypothetical protein
MRNLQFRISLLALAGAIALLPTNAHATFCADFETALGSVAKLKDMRGTQVAEGQWESQTPFPDIALGDDEEPCLIMELDPDDYSLVCPIVTTTKRELAQQTYDTFKSYITTLCIMEDNAKYDEFDASGLPMLSFSHKGGSEKGYLAFNEWMIVAPDFKLNPGWRVTVSFDRE